MSHTSTPESCPACASEDLLVVRLSPNGTPMSFTTCRHCEHRWWQDISSDVAVDLPDVLSNIEG